MAFCFIYPLLTQFWPNFKVKFFDQQQQQQQQLQSQQQQQLSWVVTIQLILYRFLLVSILNYTQQETPCNHQHTK